MTKRMLIDATHAEETRVVVLDGNRLEDFDVETSTKKQLKGNIYLAKIVRVEPSLQAAFVEYGGGRHGFLAFGEIHPDYYQIPVADRQRLLAMQAQEAREEEEAEDKAALADGAAMAAEHGRRPPEAFQDPDPDPEPEAEPVSEPEMDVAPVESAIEAAADVVADAPVEAGPAEAAPVDASPAPQPAEPAPEVHAAAPDAAEPPALELAAPELPLPEPGSDSPEAAEPHRPAQAAMIPQDVRFGEEVFEPGLSEDHVPGATGFDEVIEDASGAITHQTETTEGPTEPGYATAAEGADNDVETPDFDAPPSDLPPPETIGGESDTSDSADEIRERRSMRLLRNYRIQEVIRRRQIILVQVVKEERGTKGAALTTYISLAGRFCVLMPNSPRGGGISRKITSAADRRRLKEVTAELDLPQGMGLIVRTAGAARPKPEIKRDAEYLMRLWDDIREHTMKSVAPALIYEEASLIKRAIRDVYSRDVDEILVDGVEGWRSARDFMRMLMPGHAKKVILWSPNGGAAPQPLFSKFAVEAQLDAMLSPTVQLKSGGYLVINQTEALVAIDVNSGRSTRERGIEETALRTNLEASDEVARQLRLRDLAGLIVIDYIDMEARKHNAAVERRLTEALKNDRARIQVGHISHFGLMEMSRQRLRPSLTETSFVTCPHCQGAGMIRSVESSAVHVLRAIEDEGAKAKASHIMVHCANVVAMFLLNNKRDRLGEIEARYAMRVHFTADESLAPPEIRIDRVRPQVPDAERVLVTPVLPAAPAFAAEDEAEEAADEVFDEPEAAPRPQPTASRPPAPAPVAAKAGVAETAAESEESVRRRRRRRRRGGRRDGTEATSGLSSSMAAGEEPDDDGAGGEEGDDVVVTVLETVGADGEETVVAVVEESIVGDDIEAAVAAAAVTADEQPAIDPADLDENGLPRARRRGRRGGRRRRRDGTGEEGGEVEASAPAVAPAPAYIGPTPADPFAGHAFDIFDMMDEVEARPVATVTPRAPERVVEPPPVPTEPVPPEPVAVEAVAVEGGAVEPVAIERVEVEPVTAEPVAVAPVVAQPAAPEATETAPAETAPEAAKPESPAPIEPEVVAAAPAPVEVEAVAEAAPDVVAEPAPLPPPPPAPVIQPIVIGQDDLPATEKKRGWWKR